MNPKGAFVGVSLAICLVGCAQSPPSETSTAPAASPAAASSSTAPSGGQPAPNPENNAYFGDVHVHTGWSFDAMTNGSKTAPMDAYAWAQGKSITGSGGPEMQIKTPLDF